MNVYQEILIWSKQRPLWQQDALRRLAQKGYIEKNIVSCCDICNHAKHILSKTKFLNHIKKIYDYSILKRS